MMSLVEVWNRNEKLATSITTSKEQQHQQQQSPHLLQEHYRCMPLDTMQDIICEEETVRYVHVKSEESSGGINNNNSSINNNNNNNHGINSSSSNSSNNLPGMDKDEKRMRREIANSNERRRMQSINAGFQSLRQMLPHHEGEKLSKAAILQQTAEYIYTLEQEKATLLSQNCQLKRLIDQQDHNGASDAAAQVVSQTIGTNSGSQQQQQQQQPGSVVATVAKKRKIDTIVTVQPVSDSSDEGLGSMSPEPVTLRGISVTTNGSNGVSGASNSSAAGATNNSTTGNSNGRQCTTVNFSVKDFLELKHQLDVERRQKSIIEDQLKALERQVFPARVQYSKESPEQLIVADDCSPVGNSGTPVAPEEVAVSIIHKPMLASSMVSSKLSRVGQEIDGGGGGGGGGGGIQVISLETNNLGKNHQQIVVCSSDLIEEALSMQTVATGGGAPKQLLNTLKDDKMYIKRCRSRSPTVSAGGETTVVTLPPKKNRFPSILEAAIKAEPKVEVERISSPSSIVVTDDQMIVSSAGPHMVGSSPGLSLSVPQQQQQQQQQPPINIYHRHNLETIVEAIRHLEGDAFDKVLPAQQQQQAALHQSQPQSAQPASATSQTTIQQRPMQEVPLALTTSKQQQLQQQHQHQQQHQQPKTDRDHRQSQLEPYLKFRTSSNTPGAAVAIVSSGEPSATPALSAVVTTTTTTTTVAPPTTGGGSIITVSIAPTGSSSHAVSRVCHSPATSSTTASTIVANGSATGTAAAAAAVVPSTATVSQHHASTLTHTQTTAAQILQQQQCRPGVIVVKQNS